jgi:S1-C subfamily serine protease
VVSPVQPEPFDRAQDKLRRGAARGDRNDPLRRTVVKVFTTTRKPDHYQPWVFGHERASGGSGCVLPGNRILTNAHVVRHAIYIQVLKAGDVKKYAAKVEWVSHDEELALLTVEDETFFAGTVPAEYGGLPFRQDKIRVYGFPIGGNELSVTEGVVSRIELIAYTHSTRHLLALQTDAAINPGNSGGPAFLDGKLVGIAFQSHNAVTAQSTGYLVPMPVIEHFQRQVAAGGIDRVPSLGIHWQKIENEALREFVKLGKGVTGVLITRVVHGGSADGLLREGDVLVGVGGTRVEQDGSIELRGEDRVGFSHAVSQKRLGESIEVQILRSGRPKKVSVKLASPSWLVPRPHHDRKPTYLMFGGLMFIPLTSEYLGAWDWSDVDSRYKHFYAHELPSPKRREIVLLSHVLAHKVNAGYHQIRGAVVKKVNGKPVRQMSDLVKALKKAPGKHHVIEIDNNQEDGAGLDYHSASGTHVVLRAAEVAEATKEILAAYGVSRDRSADLDA